MTDLLKTVEACLMTIWTVVVLAMLILLAREKWERRKRK